MKDNVRSLTVVLPDGSVTRTGEQDWVPARWGIGTSRDACHLPALSVISAGWRLLSRLQCR